MSDTVTLWCTQGEHEWERKKQKGKRPKSCPEHAPKPPNRTVTPEGEVVKTEEELGREREKTAKKRRDAIRRVVQWKKWLEVDRRISEQMAEGNTEVKRIMMPPFPSDNDREIAKEEGYG